MPLLHRRPAREGGESVRVSGRRKSQETWPTSAMRGRDGRTSPVRRGGGGGRQAGQEEDGDGEHGDDGRTSHPARPGPADAESRQHAQGRKAKRRRKKWRLSLLQNPLCAPVLRCAAPRRVGFARLVGGLRKPGRLGLCWRLIASRRAGALLPPPRPQSVPRRHLALRSRTTAGVVCGPGTWPCGPRLKRDMRAARYWPARLGAEPLGLASLAR